MIMHLMLLAKHCKYSVNVTEKNAFCKFADVIHDDVDLTHSIILLFTHKYHSFILYTNNKHI